MSEIEDRRQRARVAYYDSTAANRAAEGSAVALEESIEVATQVKITDEAIEAFKRLFPTLAATPYVKGALDAALTALGFEVIE